MELHPLLGDPLAVLVWQEDVAMAFGAHGPLPGQIYRSAAGHALEAAGLRLDGEKAVLKPNVTSGEHFKDPDSGIGTHPAFIQGMVEYLQEHGARHRGIYVLEDPRNTNDGSPRHWQGTGYPEVAAATGAKLRSATIHNCIRRIVPRPLVHPVRRVSRLAVAPETVLINVPKLKTHNLGITTLCFKNQMGVDCVLDRHYCAQAMRELPQERCFPDRPRHEWMDRELHELWQEGLARRLTDLAKVVQPQLNVVEGLVGRDGTGFHRGTNYPTGLVIIGRNMVAVDSVASYLVGFDPAGLIYLRVAAGAGLGCNDISALRIYVSQDGQLVPAGDVSRLRVSPPFAVFSDIRES